MYAIWKVPVDAYDDPPKCGVEMVRMHDFALACGQADLIMEQDRDPKYVYFVIDNTSKQGFYNVGYMEPIEASA